MTLNSLGNAIWNYNHSRGVDKTSMHLFRHTYAKLYIQAGGDPFRLQKLLGHADLTMTRRYVALYADDLRANYDALNPLEQLTRKNRHGDKIKMGKGGESKNGSMSLEQNEMIWYSEIKKGDADQYE